MKRPFFVYVLFTTLALTSCSQSIEHLIETKDTEKLFKLLISDTSSKKKVIILEAFSSFESVQVVAKLNENLKNFCSSKTVGVCKEAVNTLGVLGDDSSAAYIEDIYNYTFNKNPFFWSGLSEIELGELNATFFSALKNIKNANSIDFLIKQSESFHKKDLATQTLIAILGSLVETNDPRATELLLQAFIDANSVLVSDFVVQSLADIGDDSIPRIRNLLSSFDTDYETSKRKSGKTYFLFKALERINSEKSLAELTYFALNSRFIDNRHKAIEALLLTSSSVDNISIVLEFENNIELQEKGLNHIFKYGDIDTINEVAEKSFKKHILDCKKHIPSRDIRRILRTLKAHDWLPVGKKDQFLYKIMLPDHNFIISNYSLMKDYFFEYIKIFDQNNSIFSDEAICYMRRIAVIKGGASLILGELNSRYNKNSYNGMNFANTLLSEGILVYPIKQWARENDLSIWHIPKK